MRRDARFEDEVGKRVSKWSRKKFPDEVDVALSDFFEPGAVAHDADLHLFATWFNSDREIAGRGTPCELYAARTDIGDRERDVARRIATARPGLHRVWAVEPGSWIDLEDVLDGTRVRVTSADVSREALRWDLLLGRVMAGGSMPSLWGPVRLFPPQEEPELLSEFDRLAATHGFRRDAHDRSLIRRAARELMEFVPASRLIEPSVVTMEGDPIADATAAWRVFDADAASVALDDPPVVFWVGQSDEEPGEVFQLTGDRDELMKLRPPLPPHTLYFESTYSDFPGRIGIATFVLSECELRCSAVSEPRLDAAMLLVGERLADCAELRERTVAPIDLGCASSERIRTAAIGRSQGELDSISELLNEYYLRWLDEPLETLAGHTPREAVRSGLGAEVELLLRGIENRAERNRRDGEHWPDVGWLRRELASPGELAA